MNAQEILGILNIVRSLINWITSRGVAKQRVIALLQKAVEEDRDLTTAEVQTELDHTAAELDVTEDIIEGN